MLSWARWACRSHYNGLMPACNVLCCKWSQLLIYWAYQKKMILYGYQESVQAVVTNPTTPYTRFLFRTGRYWTHNVCAENDPTSLHSLDHKMRSKETLSILKNKVFMYESLDTLIVFNKDTHMALSKNKYWSASFILGTYSRLCGTLHS